MFVALLRLDLRLPDAASLKDKRSVVKGVAASLRKLNCAVAEVDHQDLRQRTTLAVATVAGEGFHARRVLVTAEREVERAASPRRSGGSSASGSRANGWTSPVRW
jgi:uncharacterized protein YlxP (DUF503 family)